MEKLGIKKLSDAIHEQYGVALEKGLSCQFCNSKDGHDALVETGDHDSFGGFEVWFCCHACRDHGVPCETFFALDTHPDYKSDKES